MVGPSRYYVGVDLVYTSGSIKKLIHFQSIMKDALVKQLEYKANNI